MNALEQMIVCPTCLQKTLISLSDARVGDALWCSTCGAVFPVQHSTPCLIDVRMLQQLPLELLAVWHITQARAAPLYAQNRLDSCSSATREDVQKLRDFMNLTGKDVLDIGSGSYGLPGYMEETGYASYIGLDPLPVTAPPPFPLLAGLAEQLPFPGDSFDVVILATSLDHVLNTYTCLEEVVRVLKPTGEVYFWGGFVDDPDSFKELGRHPLLKRRTMPSVGMEEAIAAYVRLEQQQQIILHALETGAEAYESLLVDQFHFRHFSRASLIGAFARADLWLVNEMPIVSNDVVASVAMRFVPSPYKSNEVTREPEVSALAVQAELQALVAQVTGLNERLQALVAQPGDAPAELEPNHPEEATEAHKAVSRLRKAIRRVLPVRTSHTERDIPIPVSALHPSTGRPLRVLHIGNIANNAFNNARVQNQLGLEADLICFDYYHIMGCPEWEESDFEGDVGDPFFPDWGRVNLKGYRRPHWFAQGRQRSCVEYLMARRKHDYLRGRLWWLVMSLERNPRFLTRARTSVHLWRRVRQRVGLYSAQLHTLIRSRVRPKVWASKVTSRSKLAARSAHQTRLLYEGVNGVMKNRWSIQQVPQKNIPFKLRALSDTLTASPDEQVYYQQLIDTFATVYPDRADKLTMADIEYFRRSPLMNYFQQLFDEYDLVHAYSTDPIYPLLLNRHPYIAFEHGTIRLIPFEETARGRLTSLAYYLADGVVITNSDNLLAAQKLKLHNYTFIPHPMNEIWNRVGIGAHVREALRRELNADFVVFHPARHYWSREPLEEQKANHLLIEGLARFIREVAPRAAAIFIDWGTSVDASKALLQSLGIQDHVQWIQPMNRANMARTMDACDVVADQFFLGAFGGIPPQALALGKPTLLKFSEAMHEWCFAEFPPLINVESADGIFEALKRLYTDRNWYEQVSQAGRSWYARYHSNNIIAAKTLTMYQEALQKSQQPN